MPRHSIFRCAKCNIAFGGLGGIPNELVRSVKRTGASRATSPSKTGRGALLTTHEYVCGCGWSGWTSHPDIEHSRFDP